MVMKFPVQRGVICDPSLDGITHINVYSKGATKLGRALTNMAEIGIEFEPYGHFGSIEAFWWFLSTGARDPMFHHLSAFEARRQGIKMERVNDPEFKEKIKAATLMKLRSNGWLLNDLKCSNLPLTHYYVYGKKDNCVVRPANNSIWLIEFLESLRVDTSLA